MTPAKTVVLVLAFIALALLLAIAINRFVRWWKHRPIWNAIETPTKRDGFKLHERAILPPHKSAARPSNEMALTQPRKQAKEKGAA